MICTQAELRVFLGLSASITDEERAVLNVIHPSAERKVKKHISYDPEQRSRTEFYPRHQATGGLAIRDYSVWDVNDSHTAARLEPRSTNVNRTLQLQHIPIRSVATVHVDYDGKHGENSSGFADSTLWVQGDDYWAEFEEANVCRSGMLWANGAWPIVPGSVRVTYRAGYSTDEFAGRATTSATVSDVVTTEDLDGSGIKRAVIVTVVKAFQTWAALKKSTKLGFVPGPLSGEKLGDYSYTLAGTSSEMIAGLMVELPGEARNALEEYRHYGLMRL